MEQLIQKAREFAYSESEVTSLPIKQHVDLTTKKAIEMAKSMGARQDIVEVATLLMDAQLGRAAQEGRQPEHAQMAAEKALEMMQDFDIDKADQDNITNCILEHHGVNKFYSMESEICCNADCYRFASVLGFVLAVRYLRDMPFVELMKLLKNKAEEKWNAISLPEVKQELEPQYNLIIQVINQGKGPEDLVL